MTPSPRPRPSPVPPVQYKGSDLDAERGPGLGCFWTQLAVLAVLVVLTPVGVSLGWPDWINALLLFATIGLLLVAGQTIIFLLRIVAAERREGRRRPMAVARSRTVGELEDRSAGPHDVAAMAGPIPPTGSSAPDAAIGPDRSMRPGEAGATADAAEPDETAARDEAAAKAERGTPARPAAPPGPDGPDEVASSSSEAPAPSTNAPAPPDVPAGGAVRE